MLLFISDLHLDPTRPDITHTFLQLLEQQASQAQALYILGDLFEVWVGDDGMNSYHQHIAQALRRLTQTGTRVFLMHGNRDFMLGKRFCRMAGCQLIPDPYRIQVQDTPIVLTHGDILCTRDIPYQKMRKKLRNPVSRWCLDYLPLRFRQQRAQEMRAASQRHTQKQPAEYTDVTPEAVVRLLERQHSQTLIHGHTHQPGTHRLKANGAEAQRWVLGDWYQSAWVLTLEEQESTPKLTLKCLPLLA